MKILRKSFEEVENITNREEIEKYKNQVIPVKGDEEWDNLYKEKHPNRTIKSRNIRNYGQVLTSNVFFFVLVCFLDLVGYFLAEKIIELEKYRADIFLNGMYKVITLIGIIIFLYSLYILFSNIYDYKNYKIAYSWLIHRISIYVFILYIIMELMAIIFMYLAGSVMEFIVFLIFLIFVTIYLITNIVNEIQEKEENKINFSKYTTKILKYGGVILIINSVFIKRLPNKEIIGSFIVTGMLILMLLDVVGPRLKAYINGCYFKKYSEEFRQKFGYSVEEWYGEKSKFTKRYQKGKLL